MLRRKASAGLLRAASAATKPQAAARPRSASVGPSANLASAVLMSNPRNWKTETVVTLKAELKRRGLSQQGNKWGSSSKSRIRCQLTCRPQLLERLSTSDATGIMPPVPPLPAAYRKLSTTASASAAKANTPGASKPGREPADEQPVSTSGPDVSSVKTEVPEAEPVRTEDVTTAPGLPETKNVKESSLNRSLDVKMPGPPAEREAAQTIVRDFPPCLWMGP